MELKLWEHQQRAVSLANKLDYFALFFDAGTGKTGTLINILRDKYNYNKELLPTLILCPPVVISNWEKEFLMWSKIKKESIIKLTGTGKERAALIRAASKNSILIGNYETLNMPEVFEEYKRFLKGKSCLVLDESHKCKDVTSKRTKRAIELSKLTTYRYILTGTPILNNLMDVFSQMCILDNGKRFGSNFFTFRFTYFEDKNRYMPAQKHFPKWEAKPGAAERIKELMSDVSMHVEKATCLSLPPFVRKTIEVALGKDQQKLYDSMKKELVAAINTTSGERYSIAELAITKALRLQQIVSGHIKVEKTDTSAEGVIKIKDNKRKDALYELLEDLTPNHKVLVWAVFHQNYEDIREVCNDLKIKYSELHGLVKDKDAEAKRFREDDTVRVLIGHPGSGGIGVNLVEASYMIYYSRSFSLEYDIQSEARAYRGGSERHASITRIDLVAPGTIDELVLQALTNKIEISNSILKDRINEI